MTRPAMLRPLFFILLSAATPVAAFSVPSTPGQPGSGVYVQEVPSGIMVVPGRRR